MTPINARTIALGLAAGFVLGMSAPAFAQSSLEPVVAKPPTEGIHVKDEASRQSKLAPTSLLLDAAFAGNRIFTVGEWGHILYSEAPGYDAKSGEPTNWTQANVPVDITLTAITFVDDKNGWVVGHDGVILNTTDGGATWSLQRKDPEVAAGKIPELERPLFAVHFSDAQHGFAVGAYSLFLSTADGGKTWTEKDMGDEEQPHMNGVFQAKDGTLFIAAEQGKVFRSRDGGQNWDKIQTPYNGSFWDGLGLPDGGLLVFGMRGNIWRSDDGGADWKQIPSASSSSLQAGRVLADGRVVLIGLEGAVQTSKDGGKTFTFTARDDREAMAGLIQAKDGTLHVFGEDGVKPQPLDK